MINLKGCIELGVLTKPHGIKGNLIIKLNNFSFDDIIKMELVFVIIEGLPVPFFIEEFTERNNDSLIVKLQDVDSETQAAKLKNSSVFLKKENISMGTTHIIQIEQFIGYQVIDTLKGNIGILKALLKHELNPLMQIMHNDTEILIPYHPDFIKKVDHSNKEIIVTCPEGLLEVYY